ncbi:hypothetical protein Rsub_13295 [Raphidocelis subcapitata]|uniref:Uncharacterized protein n=1 Tax=Raphidocelis subcapitata TaxID=307507 RepID=A0A2V0PLG9_9CHLO|nr:hypothetical protein Rsub_13295 [Raphidocelis subcapitata]|eukprot:GBG00567.1 hypothetical protein Rsub_13295 [Raphidocelis subcapitata]
MQHALAWGRNGSMASRAPAPAAAAPLAGARRGATLVVRAAKHEYQVVREERPDGGVSLSVTIPGPLVQRRFTEIVDILRRCVMPVHASRALPGSESITTDVRALIDAFDPAQPLTYGVTFDCLPKVKWARDWKGIEVTVEETGSLADDEAAVDDLIQQYRKEKGAQRVAAGRGLQPGDVSIIDMRISPAGGGEPFPGLDKKRFALDTTADPLGLAKNMAGMEVGEERRWEFSFPGDWHVELWRGQRAEAVVKLRELFEWDLPEFDDAFVAAHYPSFDSAADMRKSLLATTAVERFRATQGQAADRIMEAVAGAVSVELPQSYLRAVAEKEFQERLLQMVSTRVATPEQAEAMCTEEGLAEYIAERRGELEERCKFLLAADDIAESEGIEVEATG